MYFTIDGDISTKTYTEGVRHGVDVWKSGYDYMSWLIIMSREICVCIVIMNCLSAHMIFTRGQFWPSGIVLACVYLCVCVRQPRACPRRISSRVKARTTKFEQRMQNNLVEVPIVLEGNWPWPLRSTLTWKAKFTPTLSLSTPLLPTNRDCKSGRHILWHCTSSL